MDKLSVRLKELRNEKKLYQIDIARFLDIDRTTYTKYETGENKPDIQTVCKLADYFNVSTDYLLGRSHIRDTTKVAEEKTIYGEIVAAHRSDNPIDTLPPEARKSVEDFIKFVRNQHGLDDK